MSEGEHEGDDRIPEDAESSNHLDTEDEQVVEVHQSDSGRATSNQVLPAKVLCDRAIQAVAKNRASSAASSSASGAQKQARRGGVRGQRDDRSYECPKDVDPSV